jgi:hypothetical protein
MATKPKAEDLQAKLKPLSFRGIKVPCTKRSARFQQGPVRQHVANGTHELISTTGPENWVYSYTIPFTQAAARGGYVDLWLRTLDEFLAACRDTSAGPLYDPSRGKITARCISGDLTLDALKRSGEDFTVEFIDSPPLDSTVVPESGLAALSSAVSLAGALDEKVVAAKVPEDVSTPPLSNPLKKIDGVARQGMAAQSRVAGQIDSVSNDVQRIEDTHKDASDPKKIEVARAARNLRATLKRSKIIHNPIQVIRDVTQVGTQTLADVAFSLNMTVTELLQINPGLIRSPSVRPGTKISAPR